MSYLIFLVSFSGAIAIGIKIGRVSLRRECESILENQRMAHELSIKAISIRAKVEGAMAERTASRSSRRAFVE